MRVHINTTKSPFQRDVAHFAEAQYSDELAEEGEVAITRAPGVPFPASEDFEGKKLILNNSTHISTRHSWPSKQSKHIKRKELIEE